MSDFKPGWYKTGEADAAGNTPYLYFDTPSTITTECYMTADGRQILTSEKKRSIVWQEHYKFAANEIGGKWDKLSDAAQYGSGKTSCEDSSIPCAICDQKGFPILPLRYAVARNDVEPKAPSLQAPFGSGVSEIALPEEHAKYTLRVLRSGYLYVFNEKRGDWKGYVVSDGGYLLEYKIEEGAKIIKDAKPCARMKRSAPSRCVIIPDPGKAGKVWFGFSDTEWTPAVLEKNKKDEYRKRHMRSVDVGAWVAGTTKQLHAASVEEASTQVSEFALPVPRGNYNKPLMSLPPVNLSYTYQPPTGVGYLTFDHSLQNFTSVAETAYDFLESTNKLVSHLQGKVPPMMLAINDPVGVTAEICSLMSVHMQHFLKQPAIAWPLATATTIDSLEGVIKNQAVTSLITRRNQTSIIAASSTQMTLARAFGGEEHRKTDDAARELLTTVTKEEADRTADEEWNSYLDKLEGGRSSPNYKVAQSNIHEKLLDFDQSVIVPLAQAHKAWMTSSSLASCMECNHDDNNAHSGQSYVDTLVLCIQDSQDKKICFDVYLDWLSARSIERTNLLLRAICYNQESVVREFNAVTAIERIRNWLESAPWSALIASYDESIKILSNAGQNAVVRLMAILGGPLISMVDKVFDRGVGPALIAMGVVARTPIVSVHWEGSKADAIKELVLRLQAVNPEVAKLDRLALQSAIDIELRRANIYGKPLGRGQFEYLILTDKKVVEDFPRNIGGARNAAKKLAEMSILTEEEVLEKTKLRWRNLASSDVRVSFVTGIFQVVALRKMAEDVDTSMIHERAESRWRWRAGVVAMFGVSAQLTEKWMIGSLAVGSKLSQFMSSNLANMVGKGGRILGVAAGAILAFWDVKRAVQEYQEGNSFVGTMYLISAGVGLGAMLAFSSWGVALLGAFAAVFGVLFIVAAIFVLLVIELNKDTKLHDWMERCYFGRLRNLRFSSAELQASELQTAMGK